MKPSSEDSPNVSPKLRGLYLILDQGWADRCVLADILRCAVNAGVQIVQYRNKEGAMREVYRQGLELRKIAAESRVLFVVNDRCDVGAALEADGVHLGQSDLPIDLARKLVGPNCLIGISTHSEEEVLEATAEGADYLGFGPLFPSSTKVNHERVVGIEGLRRVRTLTALPLVAIGGIQSASVSEIVGAGADGVAVASGVLGASNPQLAIKEFMKPFRSYTKPVVE